jgi:cell division protein FtsI (penicillin-binding protein 3)/stage V sporulation protein D (sporulation-specific penicillin-binding protein)
MKKNINWRIGLVLFLIVVFGAVIISRLFYLQILERKYYESQALGQQTSFNNIVGSRGQIFCENSQQTKGNKGSGEVKSMAINKDSWTISINPKNIPDKQAFADLLSENLNNTSSNQILSLLNSQSSYVVLEKGLSGSDLDKIKLLNLKGLSWENVPDRFYPQGEMASQVLGFLGGEGLGQYGLEGYYEDILKGKSGVDVKRLGLNSLFLDEDAIFLDGSDLYLTIDYNIQFQAEALLKSEQKKNDIDSGQIIVIKPDTGKILALANFPNFNPNQYSKQKDLEIFQNSVIQKLFEPGSIMKPFTMVAALNEGKITPDTTYMDTGEVVIGPNTVHNFNNEKMGEQTMTGVLENSLNTGAVFAQQKLENKVFFDYITKFGLTAKTGIDLQGEVYSSNNSLKNGPNFNYATASFGQGIEMTPIQIVAGFCALANGGKLVKPYIVEKIISGKDKLEIKPEVSRQIISQQAISQLNTMLINVVDKGFNSVAKIPGYYLAGKTGTAQIPLKNSKGYEQDKTIQSFIGYGPAFNPQFLILVKLDNPKVPKSSLSAVPVFKQLAQYIINYWQIPPDYDVNAK